MTACRDRLKSEKYLGAQDIWRSCEAASFRAQPKLNLGASHQFHLALQQTQLQERTSNHGIQVVAQVLCAYQDAFPH